ncbi:MAG: hypothetical protein PT965_06910, partial [Clostridia bacterium]|nr:hypothetical protein [Clostridia bacterium]
LPSPETRAPSVGRRTGGAAQKRRLAAAFQHFQNPFPLPITLSLFPFQKIPAEKPSGIAPEGFFFPTIITFCFFPRSSCGL